MTAGPPCQPGATLILPVRRDSRCSADGCRTPGRKVYEVDPLECPKCGAQMRVIALIQDPADMERILTWLGLWEPRQPGGPSPPTVPPSLPLTYDAVPDIA